MPTHDESAWQNLASSLQISHHDFVAFNQSHFSSESVAAFGNDFINIPVDQQAFELHQAAEWEDEEEEDDLGYYADGVKRTLTDEQIEIFRHSELRELEKQQERAKTFKSTDLDEYSSAEAGKSQRRVQNANTSATRAGKKKNKKGSKGGLRQEPKPDLRKRTWDVVEAGLDSLNYD